MSAKPRPKKPGEEGTILLRQPQPKYSFQGRKLPKETPNKQTIPDEPCKVNMSGNYLAGNGGKPVAVVGASFQGKSVTSSDRPAHLNNTMSMPDLASLAGKETLRKDVITGSQEDVQFTSNLGDQQSVTSSVGVSVNAGGEGSSSGAVTPVPLSKAVTTQVLQNVQNHFEQTQRIEQLEKEKERLSRDLDVQLQVNGELKKLLVASVGEDLSHRMEKLARDRAELTQDLGGFNKKMDEDYENFDKVSIQADMWRSKYLASRVMVEELGNARAYYALQLHDGHDALQQLLNERHELRTNLLENYKVMQQVKSAFDPLNMQRSTTLASTNILDLSRACQQLSEAMRFRLLPANVAMPLGMEGHDEIWQNCVTRAEQFAHEVLSRPREPSGCLASGSSRLLPITSSAQHINRYHPNQRHENLFFNCQKCKGEITVL